jgi:cellobiose phosphorylase
MSNEFGQFSRDGREYIITDALRPPRFQINFLWNDSLISGVNQFGSGDGMFNDRTLMYNHPAGRVQMIHQGHRYCYLQDTDTGDYWNCGNYPIIKPQAQFECAVGLSYSRYTMKYSDITAISTVYLAHDEPVEIWEYALTNTGTSTKNIRLVPFVEFNLGGYSTFSNPFSYLRSVYDAENRAVVSYNISDECPHSRYNAFVATDAEVTTWCGSKSHFTGTYGSFIQPETLVSGKFPATETGFEYPAGCLVIEQTIEPGETAKITVLIGSFDTDEEKTRLITKLTKPATRQQSWDFFKQQKTTMIDAVTVTTPDEKINFLTNIWAKQQTLLCAEFGRDGARGFRDTLQDAWGMAIFDQTLAKEKIIETLEHQHNDGHGIRGWMPLQPHHYSDGPVWIVMTVCAYLKETGDVDFLKEDVKYFDEGSGSVLEHLLRGIRFLSDDTGEHGLVHAHDGDWNDSLNWMGKRGQGESVWTSMGLYHSTVLAIELAEEILHDESLKSEMLERKQRIETAIQDHGWDGDWYLAGYTDFGEPVGAHSNDEGSIYLNPQSWAVLTGLATGERYEKCLQAIDEKLESTHGTLTCYPAYSKKDENIGRLTMIPAGIYENGTPYCHGTAFKIVADCVAGRADEALQTFYKVMPDNAAHPSIISGCEPYAYTNQYLGPDNSRAGDSVTGWITGTAGWMLRAVLEYFCGIQPGYAGLDIKPCLPTSWDEVRVVRQLRGKKYDIYIKRNNDKYEIFINDQLSPNGFISYSS